MNKQEAIKKAWEQYGIPLGQYIDENGWMNMLALTPDFIDDIRIKIEYRLDGFRDFQFGGSKYRPKSLQGIETNNSWVKIESEEDLPNYNSGGYFYVLSEEGNIIMRNGANSVINDFRFKTITHYQPITKPLKPIY